MDRAASGGGGNGVDAAGGSCRLHRLPGQDLYSSAHLKARDFYWDTRYYQAERIGLVSMAVPAEDVMAMAMQVAQKLAAHTSFDYSLALEMLGFFGSDIQEGLQ